MTSGAQSRPQLAVAEGVAGLGGAPPVAAADVVAVQPDLTDPAVRAARSRSAVDDDGPLAARRVRTTPERRRSGASGETRSATPAPGLSRSRYTADGAVPPARWWTRTASPRPCRRTARTAVGDPPWGANALVNFSTESRLTGSEPLIRPATLLRSSSSPGAGKPRAGRPARTRNSVRRRRFGRSRRANQFGDPAGRPAHERQRRHQGDVPAAQRREHDHQQAMSW